MTTHRLYHEFPNMSRKMQKILDNAKFLFYNNSINVEKEK